MPYSIAASGAGGHRDHPAVGILDAAVAQPVARRLEVGQRLERGEGLRRDDDQRRRRDRAASPHRRTPRRRCSTGSARRAVARRGRARRPAAPGPSTEPPMPMCRMPVTSPNAPASIASTSARIRWRRRGREVDVLGRAAAALGDMRRGAALARVDDLAGEQRVARRGEAHAASARARNCVDAARWSRCVFDQSK